jgi:hypothetical protein
VPALHKLACTPRVMPWRARNPLRTARASGSAVDSDTSHRRRRVGSALAPAPAQHSAGSRRATHAASSATCAAAGGWVGHDDLEADPRILQGA